MRRGTARWPDGHSPPFGGYPCRSGFNRRNLLELRGWEQFPISRCQNSVLAKDAPGRHQNTFGGLSLRPVKLWLDSQRLQGISGTLPEPLGPFPKRGLFFIRAGVLRLLNRWLAIPINRDGPECRGCAGRRQVIEVDVGRRHHFGGEESGAPLGFPGSRATPKRKGQNAGPLVANGTHGAVQQRLRCGGRTRKIVRGISAENCL
jgi:hypothetical protein